jgi:hypothetical protein
VAVISAPFIGLYLVQQYYYQLAWQKIQEEQQSAAKIVYTKYIPVFEQDNRIYQSSDKPYITLSDFTARDYRGNPPYSLQISGKGINDGGGIAYSGVLHVVAMNNEGIAIDDYYDFGGATPHVPLEFRFSLKYNSSSPITNCTITPVYTDTVS